MRQARKACAIHVTEQDGRVQWRGRPITPYELGRAAHPRQESSTENPARIRTQEPPQRVVARGGRAHRVLFAVEPASCASLRSVSQELRRSGEHGFKLSGAP